MRNFQQNPDSSEKIFFDASQRVCIGGLDEGTQKLQHFEMRSARETEGTVRSERKIIILSEFTGYCFSSNTMVVVAF